MLINPIFTDRDQILLTLEYAGEQGASDLASRLRPFDSDIALRLFWGAQNFARTSIELTSAVDLGDGEPMLAGTLGSQLRCIYEEPRFELAGRYLHPASSPDSLLADFTDNSFVSTTLRLDL